MTAYNELVKALRLASTVSIAWKGLMMDAAAAIEELKAQIPKQGKWVHQERDFVETDGDKVHYVSTLANCSVCGFEIDTEEDEYKYCPCCGAKMEVQE